MKYCWIIIVSIIFFSASSFISEEGLESITQQNLKKAYKINFEVEEGEPKLQKESNPRKVILLASNWMFHLGDNPSATQRNFDDSEWQKVDIPHCWHKPGDNKEDTVFWPGISWYRTKLFGDSRWEDRSIFLEFNGAGRVSEVFINEQSIGVHKSPYGRFRYEVSKYIDKGSENLIAIRIDNNSSDSLVGVGPQRIGWAPYGGVYRNVKLIVTNPVHIDLMDNASSGVYVTPSKITGQSAVIQVVARLANDLSEEQIVNIKAEILDAEGRIVDTLVTSEVIMPKGKSPVRMITSIKNPHLWNGVKDPYMYSLRLVLEDNNNNILDVADVPFGIRTFHFDPDRGFFLNGQPYPLRGVSLHQERKGQGWALTPEMQEEDVKILREMGSNAIRAHYQLSEDFYEICARTGILIWAEIPFWQYSKVTKSLEENAKLQLRELVLQNYNNPSHLIWSVGNECYVRYPAIRSFIAEMHDYVYSMDRTRVTTYANPRNFGDIPQQVSELTDIASYNWYCGWYIDTNGPDGPASRVGELADSYHAYYPNQSIGISEYGASGCIDQHEQNPTRPNPTGPWFPEEYQTQLHEVYWPQVAERPYLYGVFIWSMYDFVVPGWSRGSRPHMNWKGMVTHDRKIRKDVFYYYKANWTEEPFVHITSQRHEVRNSALTLVKIYSNCPKVTLWINGELQQTVDPDYCVYKWENIKLQPGENTIRVLGKKDGIIYQDECKWDYKPKR